MTIVIEEGWMVDSQETILELFYFRLVNFFLFYLAQNNGDVHKAQVFDRCCFFLPHVVLAFLDTIVSTLDA